eukprot:scaffold20148_cov97-Isochrysis_galbana.AAC.1
MAPTGSGGRRGGVRVREAGREAARARRGGLRRIEAGDLRSSGGTGWLRFPLGVSSQEEIIKEKGQCSHEPLHKEGEERTSHVQGPLGGVRSRDERS